MAEDSLTYRSAGVDIDEAQRSLRSLIPAIRATHGEAVIGGIGGFGGLFRGSFPEMERPVLVSSIDGVGTKTRVAAMVGDFSGLGHDIVNHCVNDILCQGARPLFFLDYFAASKLQGSVFEPVIGGMAAACAENDCALLGGETAEMPGVYADDEIDVVGSIVGVVDYELRLPRPKPASGDAVIGLASNGLHTNGFSLARKALEVGGVSVRDEFHDGERSGTIGEALLRPHRSYFSAVYPLIADFPELYGIAHITGGGLYDNVPRTLPSDRQAVIERSSWRPPEIFRLIQDLGKIEESEMYRTFNMGIGMVLVVGYSSASEVVRRLNEAGEAAAIIGSIQEGISEVKII